MKGNYERKISEKENDFNKCTKKALREPSFHTPLSLKSFGGFFFYLPVSSRLFNETNRPLFRLSSSFVYGIHSGIVLKLRPMESPRPIAYVRQSVNVIKDDRHHF